MDEHIRIEDAVVYFPVKDGTVKAVDHVTATFLAGEITGLIGESGCGKSVLGMAILGLLPEYARVEGGIWLEGRNLLAQKPGQMRRLRGRKLGLIPQNPADSFNPVRRIKGQIREGLQVGADRQKKGARRAAAAEAESEGMDNAERLASGPVGGKTSPEGLLEEFGFTQADAARVARSYPFELSGGMLQRAAAAMGTASLPEWILADEPSKGLDESLRRQLYQTLLLVKERGAKGMVIITHDLELAGTLCDSLAVMYSGEIVEMGKNILTDPKHPYTRGLLASLPQNGMRPMKGSAPAPGEHLTGCKFAARCPHAAARCFAKKPESYPLSDRTVRCFLYA